jgi:hypothetical protein
LTRAACSPPIRTYEIHGDPRQLVVAESLLGAAVPAAQRIGAEQIDAPPELVRGGEVGNDVFAEHSRIADRSDRLARLTASAPRKDRPVAPQPGKPARLFALHGNLRPFEAGHSEYLHMSCARNRGEVRNEIVLDQRRYQRRQQDHVGKAVVDPGQCLVERLRDGDVG